MIKRMIETRQDNDETQRELAKAIGFHPEGFEVGENQTGEKLLFKGEEHYELTTDKDENPVIFDHNKNGTYIPLKIIKEGWN